MHPSSLLSYYPTYSILDEILSYSNNYKTLNLFFDLKNNLQTTYMQHAIENIINDSKNSKFINTSVFSSVLSFIAFHKLYSIKRNININFFIFFETGNSFYHKNISKKYKSSRHINDLYGLNREDRDIFYDILQKNFTLIEKACNRMPNIKVIKLDHFEADFIPYYLITRNIINQENSANVIYSNDHDLMQVLNDNTYIFRKMKKYKGIVKKGDATDKELKFENDIPDSYLPLILSVVGDKGDDVEGIKGIGPKTFNNIFPELKELLGSMEDIYGNISNNKPIFSVEKSKSGNKHIDKIINEEIKNKKISDNLRLVSFELISREFEDPSSTEVMKRKNDVLNLLKDNSITNKTSMLESLNMINVDLDNEELDTIYFKKT